jgi:hypothetical protein
MGRMSARRLREVGLLWHINESVLWPLGLMLTVDIDPSDPDDIGELFVQVMEPADVVSSGAGPLEEDDKADRLRDFTIERMEQIREARDK